MSQFGTGFVLIGNTLGQAGFAVAKSGTGLVLVGNIVALSETAVVLAEIVDLLAETAVAQSETELLLNWNVVAKYGMIVPMAEVALYGDTVSISGTAVSLDWYNVALAGAPGILAGDSGTLF